jgi:hypothetical protein
MGRQSDGGLGGKFVPGIHGAPVVRETLARVEHWVGQVDHAHSLCLWKTARASEVSQPPNKILQAAAVAALGLSLSSCNPPPDRTADSAHPDPTASPSTSAYHSGGGAYASGAAAASRQDDDNDRSTDGREGHGSTGDADGHGGFGSSGAAGDGG